MSFHVCHKCGKHGDVAYNSSGFRQAYIANCQREDCPPKLAAKRFKAMENDRIELPPDERMEK